MSESNASKATASGSQQVCKPQKPKDTSELIDTQYIDPKEAQSIAYGNVDKRVSLTVSPKTYERDESKFAERVSRVLGSKTTQIPDLLSTSKFYGLLRNALGTSSGLIFPYTPTVTFSHQTNYNRVDIIHSNIAYNYYKNSPPPTITMQAKFTADNRDNALHMLSAIWFLIACSKCEFGEKSANPGLPPPVLYLNGYDHLMDNIPVVITSVRYSYPENKHYVNLIIDFTKPYSHTAFASLSDSTNAEKNTYDNNFCKIYIDSVIRETKNTYKVTKYTDIKDENGNVTGYDTKGPVDVPVSTYENHDHGINYSFWLPTDIQIEISLAVQPNLLKIRKQWTLDDYKSGVLLTESGKNPAVWLPNSITVDKLLSAKKVAYNSPNGGENECPQPTSDNSGKWYKFIESGWTW